MSSTPYAIKVEVSAFTNVKRNPNLSILCSAKMRAIVSPVKSNVPISLLPVFVNAVDETCIPHFEMRRI